MHGRPYTGSSLSFGGYRDRWRQAPSNKIRCRRSQYSVAKIEKIATPFVRLLYITIYKRAVGRPSMLSDEERLTVVNVVASTRVAEELDLPDIAIQLNCEYEPEQFPGLIYRLDYPRVVCLIFGSGKMVITGARHKDEILEAVEQIKDELADLL